MTIDLARAMSSASHRAVSSVTPARPSRSRRSCAPSASLHPSQPSVCSAMNRASTAFQSMSSLSTAFIRAMSPPMRTLTKSSISTLPNTAERATEGIQ